MIRNYLSVALRSLQKHKFYSLLNIAGLALGLAACLLLATWIRHELSYDNFHARGAQLYRVALEYSFGGQTARTAVSPTALLPTLQKNFPEVAVGVRFYNDASYNPFVVRHGDKVFQEKNFLYADSTFFEIFSFDIYAGNPARALTEPNSVVLTRSSAPALGMTLAAGRNFTEADMARVMSDTLYAFILNETALSEIGLTPENAPGTRVNMNGRRGSIIGAVKDFHFAPLQKKITPLVLFNEPGNYNYVFVTLKAGNPTASIAALRPIMQNLAPHRPFEYVFLDDQYNRIYDSEQRMGKIVTTFALMTIVIACLGLLGLVAFSAAQKTKEIGIRKVLGATPYNIVVLITREFATLVIAGIVIGLPVAWWSMNGWLGSFAYRTDIGIMPVVASSAICLLIAFGAASYQAIQASLLDPATTLRAE